MAATNILPLEDLIGTRFTLLDSVRDAGFLSGNNTGQDFGLGILDNPLFVFTSTFTPNPSSPGTFTTTPRPYPNKFFWLGSPSGTNDLTDVFNIYVADVNPDQFAPGVSPAPDGGVTDSWLVNPRLVLSFTQAKGDIVTWFDANYPGGASGGVGSSNTGTNSTYGTLASGSSAVGNISGSPSLDGQFWPIYDLVDNTVLLYFSVKTPNVNTLSIYCYKLTDTEFGSPASSSEFLGGLFAPGWVVNLNAIFTQGATLFSSHRFSIVSPDPLTILPRPKGTQNAVFMYCYGAIDGISPDHGRNVTASVVVDIHTNPLSPAVAVGSTGAIPPGSVAGLQSSLVGEEYYTPDKLGSIFAANAVDAPTPGYVCIYNTPLQIDRRPLSATYTKNSPVLSAMQLRVMYYNPSSGMAFGSDPIRMTQTPQILGTCRAQFTDLPDGKTKIIYANFSWDQYLNLAYEYTPNDALSPRKQRQLRVFESVVGSAMVYTYGKNKMTVRSVIPPGAASNSLSANANILQLVGGENFDPENGFNFGAPPFIGSKYIHQENAFGWSSVTNPLSPSTEFVVDELDSYVAVLSIGKGKPPSLHIELTD